MSDAITDGLHVCMSLSEQMAELDRQIEALGIKHENFTRDSCSTYENPIRTGSWPFRDKIGLIF